MLRFLTAGESHGQALVVVDSLDVSSSGAGAGGTPKLSVNVQARTFAASGGGAPTAGGA